MNFSMHRMVAVFLALAGALPLAAGAAHAQFFPFPFNTPRYREPPREVLRPRPAPMPRRVLPQQQNTAAPGTPGATPKLEGAPPPYDVEMTRLAEILGALQYLRPLCGAAEANRWRSEMQEIINAEQPSQERRDRLTATFNRSYVSYEQTYRSCTPAADMAIARYVEEGAKLAREIATRYSY